MTAKWSFGSVGIYVTEEDTTREVKRAEIIALDAVASTYHYFGAGSKHYSIKGIVVGNTDLEQLETWAINNTAQTFTTPWATITSCKLDKNVKASAIKYSGAVLDGVSYSAETTPLYTVQLEIIPT